LPTGAAYTVFTGIGAVGTIIFGILFLNESVSVQKILFSALLVIGILGLKITTKEE
ncbi:QacE family quaternary ammonium compound efflux SMR transporter, partial [Enterococcus hirae]